MKRCRITFEISKEDRTQIENTVKKEYPKLKNVSDVIRLAIKEFLLTNKKEKQSFASK